uniref:Uncharacterized protein n=2 Tax=Bombyx mori TaxID=7091 RepID=A0A8R2AK15_BOMMO|nr:actin cytoskeleton-regulatory complex protein PAN1 [Bombyx mori]
MKMKRITFSVLLVCILQRDLNALKLPGPLVYVVTPSPRPPNSDEGRSAPFYYHNWIRRMDSPKNESSSTSTTTEKTKTPDLIFAEFESSSNVKSIRKLLEKEKIDSTSTVKSILRPIYVPDEETDEVTRVVNYGLPVKADENKDTKPTSSDSTDYFSMYNNLYNNEPVPVYVPSTTIMTTTSTASPTTTTTTSNPMNVENIWHIIDNQKYDEYAGKWEEEVVADENTEDASQDGNMDNHTEQSENSDKQGQVPLDENFALPGFTSNPGNGAENESRAIRTEPKFRFPYVNLKPFQVKDLKKPSGHSKTGNNMFNLNDFRDVKNPVRGEAQDVVPIRQPIDRYNPAQPYLPQPYGGNSKQSGGYSAPEKAVANLVPPPPPPPKLTDNDFPAPSSYESFPPYASASAPNPSPAPPAASPLPSLPVSKPVITMYQPPIIDSSDSSDAILPPSDDMGPPTDLGYHYQQPPTQFLPTVPPMKTKPFNGYSYNKPSLTLDTPPALSSDEKPEFQGYVYSKPEPPSMSDDHMAHNHPLHSHVPSNNDHHDSDYPELIYNKPHDGMSDAKGGSDMKGTDMAPPPLPYGHGPSMDAGASIDQGFPHDFPGDFKFHHDFDDHDYHHHHHPHPTTTTTTEQPRVNRYSYYYLGKKLYYLPLYFSVYFIIYVGALIIKAVLRHKIVYPNSWRPNGTTASFFSKRSVDSWDLSNENIHEITGKVTHAIASAAEKYMDKKKK